MGQAKRERRLKANNWKTQGLVPDSTSKHTVQQSSRLLMLPAELRNTIYDHLLSSGLSLQSRGNSLSTPPLARTCRQLRNDFLPIFNAMWPSCMTSLMCEVRNFDFEELIRLLGHMSANARAAIENGQNLTIKLSFDKDIKSKEQTESLRHWLSKTSKNEGGVYLPRARYVFVGSLPEAVGYFTMFNIFPRIRNLISENKPGAKAEWESVLRSYRWAQLKVAEPGRPRIGPPTVKGLKRELRAMGDTIPRDVAEDIIGDFLSYQSEWFEPSPRSHDMAWATREERHQI